MSKRSLYIGLMSGTSLDGVDVALCRVDKSACTLLASLEYPLSDLLRDDILSTLDGVSSVARVGELDHRLGILFADAVNAMLQRESLFAKDIVAIGSHGQTLWHQPNGEYPFSLQLGDPNLITALTGIKVVADFRRKDIALGGQGAPLVPAFHQFLFSDIAESVAILNIGGMANITIIGETLLGYDTGCGNVLMDAWIVRHTNKKYDRDGLWAKSGSVQYTLLEKMLGDDYFSQPYPKSTGREKFNFKWLEDMLIGYEDVADVDIQRTLLELTAISISNEVLKFQRDILLLCGGGARNIFLVERLQTLMPNLQILIANDADSLEAMAFAWLAYKRMHGEVINLKDVTGARENGILGGVYE